MKRETIKFKTEEEILEVLNEYSEMYEEDNPPYEIIQQEKGNFDGEKGIVKMTVIIKRVSDSKFFSGTYSKGMQGNNWCHEKELEEVFPEKTTITTFN